MHRRKVMFGLAALGATNIHAQPQGAVEEAVAQPQSRIATVHPALHLVGDSTMADRPLSPPQPERGWGQLLREYLKEPERLVNHAASGRSGKSFRAEGRWDRLMGQLAPGDYVLIQFGHNDQKSEDPSRYAEAGTTYREQMERFVREVRSKRAEPLLATSIVRRKFDDSGRLINTLGDYPAVTREVAATLQVPLLDMNGASEELVNGLGPEASKSLYMWVPAGQWPRLPSGRRDDTHFSEAGAREMARLAVDAIKAASPPLAAWFK